MAYYEGRVGVVSQSIDNMVSMSKRRVPHSNPVASAFLDKDESFVQPFQVKNNTYYSKQRPSGQDAPKSYNYVPLNQKPENEVNLMNAPVLFPTKLHYQDIDNRFMDNVPMDRSAMPPHQSQITLEELVRPN